MNTWTVCYRVGGFQNCEWRRTIAFKDYLEARKAADSIEQGGREALIFKTSQLNSIGNPIGWEA